MIRLMLIVFAALLVVCSDKGYDEARAAAYKAHNDARQKFYESVEKEHREWKVRAAIQPGDTSQVIVLRYRDEIGLTEQTVYCMAVFENAKEYKLVAPWIHTDVRIQKANVLGDELETVKRKQLTIR